ncbi:MAG: PfaD family polyunsaturated fatty acid/polyketide biosynthesis protein [Gemmataceae bacterium]
MTFRTGRPEPRGWWRPEPGKPANPATTVPAVAECLGILQHPVFIVGTAAGPGVVFGGTASLESSPPPPDAFPLLAHLPPLPPEQLGDPAFTATYNLRYPYMTGAMANGIASVEIVEAMAAAGMLGSFGAAGLSLERITSAVQRLQQNCDGRSFAINIIHSPNEPAHEAATAAMLIERGVRVVEASAYLDLTPAIVRYRVAGLRRGAEGRVQILNRVIAKVSRTEVATRFLSPAPKKILDELLVTGQITPEQAALAATVPMCDDLTGEADSGGHTDNRPAITLLPTLLALRDRLQAQFGYAEPVRVGLAGGIATPSSVAAAFAMGAAYIVTGSINQACRESGSSDAVRKMLAEAGQADVAMAPAADMFEMGVKLQVLKRGTMFPMRAAKLYEVYRTYPSWDAVPPADKANIEKTMLRASFDEIWTQTRDFFAKRDPTQLPRAEADPKHRMALVFRWYLGLSSRWANSGDATRVLDYQVWCGPAMGAFNEWARGSVLEGAAGRTIELVALNLLVGGCVMLRQAALRQAGLPWPAEFYPTAPQPMDVLHARLA